MKLEVNGLSVNCEVFGEGEDLLVLEGWGAPISVYAPLCAHMAEYRRVIIPDMPGVGGTQEPESSMCADDYADFILSLLGVLGVEKTDIIGHSNGGRTALKLLSRPDLPVAIERAALLGPAGIVHEKSAKQKLRSGVFKAGKKVLGSAPVKALFPEALENLRRKSGSEDYRKASPVMRETLVRLVNEDLRASLPDIKASVLLICGENDTATPLEDVKLMSELIPDSGLVPVRGGSHYCFLEQPQLIYRILDSFFGRQ